jgi:methylthioribose-1-phosphate isomerase
LGARAHARRVRRNSAAQGGRGSWPLPRAFFHADLDESRHRPGRRSPRSRRCAHPDLLQHRALATAGHGTALGVIRSARDQGKRISVVASETRPYLQGARLTAWELMQEKIPVTLITDNMAGHLMSLGRIDLVIVGADRIAANGDVANKIGTYTLAVLAERHGIPFYVAAPLSTIDVSVADGAAIPIEERGAAEVTGYAGVRWAPEGVAVANPAFDITPAALVSALFTEKGVVERPDAAKIRALFDR